MLQSVASSASQSKLSPTESTTDANAARPTSQYGQFSRCVFLPWVVDLRRSFLPFTADSRQPLTGPHKLLRVELKS